MNTLPRDPGPAPKEHSQLMQWLLKALAILLDFLKLACLAIIFLAPLAVGIGVKYVTEPALVNIFGPTLGDSLASAAGWIAGTATAGAEIVAEPVTGILEGIGIMAAIFVGLIGWLLLILLLLFSGGFDPFASGGEHFLIILAAFAASVTPLVDGVPTFTPAIWKIVGDLKKRDAKLRSDWEAKNKAYQSSRAENQRQRVDAVQAAYGENQTEEEPAFAPERPAREIPVLATTPNYASA